MARRASTFRQSDVERALKAARSAGLTVGGVEVAPDGTIRVMVADGRESGPATPYDEWKAKRDARATKGH
jgi:hypothetical protein